VFQGPLPKALATGGGSFFDALNSAAYYNPGVPPKPPNAPFDTHFFILGEC